MFWLVASETGIPALVFPFAAPLSSVSGSLADLQTSASTGIGSNVRGWLYDPDGVGGVRSAAASSILRLTVTSTVLAPLTRTEPP